MTFKPNPDALRKVNQVRAERREQALRDAEEAKAKAIEKRLDAIGIQACVGESICPNCTKNLSKSKRRLLLGFIRTDSYYDYSCECGTKIIETIIEQDKYTDEVILVIAPDGSREEYKY